MENPGRAGFVLYRLVISSGYFRETAYVPTRDDIEYLAREVLRDGSYLVQDWIPDIDEHGTEVTFRVGRHIAFIVRGGNVMWSEWKKGDARVSMR
jgi:hypothetical protein